MAKYLTCGNSLYDSTATIAGQEFGEHIGGQAVYGTAGVRTWTKSVKKSIATSASATTRPVCACRKSRPWVRSKDWTSC